MIRDITLGQYFPGESPIHKLDPRTKVMLTLLYVVSLFVVRRGWGYLVSIFMMILIVCLSRIPFSVVLRGVKPILFVLLFTAAFNLIYGRGTPIFADIGWLSWLTWNGLRNAVFMAVRIMLLVIGTSFMTYTTSPIMLTGAMEWLLAPLKWVKVPVHELSMMMTIALRFIPTLVDETDKIINAQKARGADFETGNIFRRAKALVPILIPLIISAFRRAEELADAMECRCYHGGNDRTKYKVFRFAPRDAAAWLVMTVQLALIILINVVA